MQTTQSTGLAGFLLSKTFPGNDLVPLLKDPEQNYVLLQEYFSHLENEPQLVVVLNQAAEVAYLNLVAGDKLSMRRHQAVGCCWLTRFIPEYQRRNIMLEFDRMMMGLSPDNTEYSHEVLSESGMFVPIQWQNRILKSHQGEVLGVISVGSDIRESLMPQELIPADG